MKNPIYSERSRSKTYKEYLKALMLTLEDQETAEYQEEDLNAFDLIRAFEDTDNKHSLSV